MLNDDRTAVKQALLAGLYARQQGVTAYASRKDVLQSLVSLGLAEFVGPKKHLGYALTETGATTAESIEYTEERDEEQEQNQLFVDRRIASLKRKIERKEKELEELREILRQIEENS